MFSIPSLITITLMDQFVGPAFHTAGRLLDTQMAALVDRVRVVAVPASSDGCRAERTVRIADRTEDRYSLPNGVGDTVCQPYDEACRRKLLSELSGPGEAIARARNCVRELPGASSLHLVLAALAAP